MDEIRTTEIDFRNRINVNESCCKYLEKQLIKQKENQK